MTPPLHRHDDEHPRTIQDFLSLERPLVIAHRGWSFAAPENTLTAFRRALDLGVDMIELDVQLSREGEVVVFHDTTLDRCTDGKGRVDGHTRAELRELDAGSWFDATFQGETIPTLSEVLDLVAERSLLNVELKADAIGPDISGGLCERTIDAIHAAGASDRILLSSFEPRALEQARQIDPSIARGSLYNRSLHRGLSPLEIMDAVGASTFNLSRRQIDADIIATCRAAGRPVLVYTVNEVREMARLLDLGASGLFTDRPDVLIDLLATRD